MTLTDVHANPVLLADYLGIAPEGALVERRYFRVQPVAVRPETRDEFLERVRAAWKDYHLRTNPNKGMTWGQMIREALRACWGMRKGSVAECRARLLADHPEVYSSVAAQVGAV